MSGILYIVATPIGNLEDITLRALRILKEVDLIAAEDTRHTRKLLTHFQISKPLISYYEHNRLQSGPEIIRRLQEGGNVALVSDAGTPGISDPGSHLIRLAIEQGIKIVPIPGPSAAISALSASGLATDKFIFIGFLPIKSGQRIKVFEKYKDSGATLVIYESPHRLLKTLEDMKTVWGGDQKVVLAKELTKIHEDFIRDTLEKVPGTLYASSSVRGEWVILV